MRNYQSMVNGNKKKSEVKTKLAFDAIEAMVENEEEVRICTLVERTGLSRAFFNKPEIKKRIDKARIAQGDNPGLKQKTIVEKALIAKNRELEAELARCQEKLKQANAKIAKLEKQKEIKVAGILESL